MFCIWTILNKDEAKEEFTWWKTWIGESFTWLYIGSVVSTYEENDYLYLTTSSQKVWLVFVAVIYFSKYSNIKIGPEDSKPEYNDATW